MKLVEQTGSVSDAVVKQDQPRGIVPMSLITGVLYGTLAFYIGGWMYGHWGGNLSGVLATVTLITGGYWVAEKLHFGRARERARRSADTQTVAEAKKGAKQQSERPWWIEATAGLFPVLLVVFMARSFAVEPFKIPSGSMIPTLLVGDFVLVNKFEYGLRIPFANRKVVENHDPARGDVVVFRYPAEPKLDYIKRVVGVPGDEVKFIKQRLWINGVELMLDDVGPFVGEGADKSARLMDERIGSRKHQVVVDPQSTPDYGMKRFAMNEQCTYTGSDVTCTVPAGHYFMMGDNRDKSQDSRFWGFVPDDYIVGKAVLIWMSYEGLGRIGFVR